MRDMPLPQMPADLYTFSTTAAEAYRSLDQQSADARAKRTDVIGQVALEEMQGGKSGWRERTQLRLSQSEDQLIGLKVISDAVKIFQLFRLPEGNIRFTREEMSEYQPGRLRAFAQNMEWSREAPEEVRELLSSGRNENVLRQEIQERSAASRGEEAPREIWESLVFRVSPAQAAMIRSIMDGAQLKAQQVMGMSFSEREAVRAGELLHFMLEEWRQYSDEYDDGEGGVVSVENQNFVLNAAEPVAAD